MIVQWVPHAYGFRAMNLGFCLWLWSRASRGDDIELMVHEPYLAFWGGSWRQTAAAIVHRLMTVVLLRSAQSDPTGSGGALSGAKRNVSPASPASTSTRPPSRSCPKSISSASTRLISVWMRRAIGRAPKSAS